MNNSAGGLPEQSRYDFDGLTGVLENLFPYCLELQEDGRWRLLNRNYQPIGCRTLDRSGNEVMQFSFRLKGFGPARRRALCVHGRGGNKIHLYNGGCWPTLSPEHKAAYLKKIAILIPMETREERW